MVLPHGKSFFNLNKPKGLDFVFTSIVPTRRGTSHLLVLSTVLGERYKGEKMEEHRQTTLVRFGAVRAQN
jgi:hypothetical protein